LLLNTSKSGFLTPEQWGVQGNEMNQQGSTPFDWKAFSQRTWVVVVSGLVFPPLGIFLSWRKTDWAPKAKWIATGLLSLLLLWRMGGSEKKERSAPGTVAEATAAADKQEGGLYLVNIGDIVGYEYSSSEQPHLSIDMKSQQGLSDADVIAQVKAIESMPRSPLFDEAGWESQKATARRILQKIESYVRSGDGSGRTIANQVERLRKNDEQVRLDHERLAREKAEERQRLVDKGSIQFKSVVARLRKAGFRVEIGKGSDARHIGSAVGIKSDGEDNFVVSVGDFSPFNNEDLAIGDEPVRAAIMARSHLRQCVGSMSGAINQMTLENAEMRNLLQYTDATQRHYKTTNNGTTHFAGIMLIGDEQCEVSWVEKTRVFPDAQVWRLEYEDAILMTGLDERGESRASKTRLMQKLLTGGKAR
jgi:hypothetical protein